MDIQYFAAKPADELASEVMDRVEDFYTFIRSSGIFARIRKSYQAYYGMSDKGFSSTGLGSSGDQGELSTLKVNQYRSIIQGLLNLTTSQKASFEVRATNTDFKSQTQTILAQGILDYYLREKNLERLLREAVEISLWGADGYLMATWAPTAGEEHAVNPETQKVEYQGDILYETKHALEMVKDVNALHSKDPDWLVPISWENKFDLAARYPEQAEKILAIEDNRNLDTDRLAGSLALSAKESALIPVYHFYHKRSDAVRDGRYMILLDAETYLFDGPLPYRKLPVHRIASSELFGTPFGYSPAFDLLGIQEIYDIVHSSVATNQSTHGVGNVWTKPGSGLTVAQLQSGMNHWESEEEPKAINLSNTPAELFKYMEHLEHLFESLSGIGSMLRGQPQSQMSGAAMALIASQAVQFNSGLQHSWANLLEDVGTATFQILQDFAKVPRLAVIVGKHNRSLMKEFSSDDIAQVSRVVVDLGNPLSRTTAGRVEMANQLLGAQKFETPEQYLNVISTGKLEPLTESRQTQLLNIKAENEMLREAKRVEVVKYDNHHLHILEHMSTTDDPGSRSEANVIGVVGEHVNEHMFWWWYVTVYEPTILTLRSLPPFQGPPPPMPARMQAQGFMLPPPPMPMGQPPGAPGAPPPPQGGVNPGPMNPNPAVAEAQGIKGPSMPSMPKGAPDGLQDAYGQVKNNAPVLPVA